MTVDHAGESDGGRALPRPAARFLAAVLCLGAVVDIVVLARLDAPTARQWLLIAIVLAAGSLTQLRGLAADRTHSSYLTGAVVVAAALLLPAGVVAVVAVAIHLPEWIVKRRPWSMHVFAIANVGISGVAAAGAARALSSLPVVSKFAAAAVFFALSHLLLAEMLRRTRGLSYVRSGLLSASRSALDLSICMIGIVAAVLWQQEPWILLALVAPLLLAQRSLAMPKLEEEARVDPKTQLANSRAFQECLERESTRARRYGRALAVLMIDIDHFKRVNDRYGHVAGDELLSAVAAVVAGGLRSCDLAARFGGEEFAVVLPDTDLAGALRVAERIRKAAPAAASGELAAATLTVSIGVACSDQRGHSADRLVAAADEALYRAKAAGRNQVHAAGEERRGLPVLVPSAGATSLVR